MDNRDSEPGEKELVTLKVWSRSRTRLAHLRAHLRKPATQILDELIERELERCQAGVRVNR